MSLAVCIHPGNLHWRRVLGGILEACAARRWLAVAIPDTSEGLGLLAQHHADAALVNLRDPGAVRAAARLALPLVNLGQLTNASPRVRLDDPAIGAAGASALASTGVAALTFAGEHLGPWAAERRSGALGQARALGVRWLACAPAALQDYTAWIGTLPRATGILACNDEIAAQVALAAAATGRAVPRTLRILGVDDDDLQCRHARTPLSSLRLDLEGLGARAVAVCADLLASRPVPPDQRLAGAALVERASTSGARLGGLREVALRLGSGPLTGLDVGILAAGAGISRRTLGRRMRSELGCTPRDALHRQRLARAKELLRSTGDPLTAIATHCGYSSASHLCAVFRRNLGLTPMAWRAGHDG